MLYTKAESGRKEAGTILNTQKTGSLIAAIRKEQNRTQRDLANELGVSSAAISKWERGVGFPDVSLVEPLAESLGITIAELFKGERIEESVDREYESLLSDVVKVSADEIGRKKRLANWIIAATVAALYVLISGYRTNSVSDIALFSQVDISKSTP